MLGPEIKTYSRNTIVFIVSALLLIACVGFASALWKTPDSREAAYGFLAAAAAIAFMMFWQNSAKLTIHSNGVSSETIFGRDEILFDDVTHLHYNAVKQSVNFIPVGTYHNFKLVDCNGKKIKFGNRFSGMKALSNELIVHTSNVLVPKLAKRFDAGETLEFGPIKMSRDAGITIKSMFSTRTIAWNELADYRIEQGNFYFFSLDQKRDTGTLVSKIPNAFVLLGLLNAICAPAAQTTTAGK